MNYNRDIILGRINLSPNYKNLKKRCNDYFINIDDIIFIWIRHQIIYDFYGFIPELIEDKGEKYTKDLFLKLTSQDLYLSSSTLLSIAKIINEKDFTLKCILRIYNHIYESFNYDIHQDDKNGFYNSFDFVPDYIIRRLNMFRPLYQDIDSLELLYLHTNTINLSTEEVNII